MEILWRGTGGNGTSGVEDEAWLTRFADDFRRAAEANGATFKAIATVWGMISSFAG